ncbi:MAG: hypothetical protein OXU26_09755, partial [Acidobacteriota bacterium]|nr:hypothetical protein [Acidobacteriota bacterium]
MSTGLKKAGRHWLKGALVTVLILSLSHRGAGSEGVHSSSSEPELVSIRLEPETVKLQGAGATRRFLVLGQFSDGLQREVTSASRLRIADPSIARLGASGQVVSVSSGRTELRAEFGGKAAQAGILTVGTERRRPFSFSWDIGGILTKRGCNGSSCHGGVKGRGGFRLSSDATDPVEDYQWIVRGGGYQVLTAEPLGPRKSRIDLDRPEESLLLRKPSFKVAH